MKEHKNIERLFQEKFKHFEVVPPETAWKNIEVRLNEKKKKKRVLPFWFKAAGIAASLFLGIYIYSLFNSSIDNNKIENNSIVVDDKKNDNEIENNNNTFNSSSTNNVVITNNDNSPKNNNPKNINSNKSNAFQSKTKNKIIVKTGVKLPTNSNKDSQLTNQKNTNYITLNKGKSDKNKGEINNADLIAKENYLDKLNKILDVKNRSVVVDKTTNNGTQDSSLVAQISKEVTALEQLLKEKEVGKNVEEKEKEMKNKWAISSYASPVYFNSATNGSPINTQFTENSKTYASTLSYGVGLSYALSGKLSLRTGVNSLALEYNTNEVAYATTLKNAPNDGTILSRNSNGQNIVFVDKNSAVTLSNDVENYVQNDIGKLNQTTSYFEVPVELSYKLIDKRFGLEFIGGMSSLFLNQNSISLLSNGMEMEIGKANNLNKIHFSSNVGIGFKYSFLKSLEVNFNPMFKYQLNTYSDNSGNFKPYFIGLYSGLSYKF